MSTKDNINWQYVIVISKDNSNMERKKQTGHICRWMALGIMIATIVVGCTIGIGLFEWRDRSSMENRNAELHLWRKSMYDLNIHVTKLALLGVKRLPTGIQQQRTNTTGLVRMLVAAFRI